jgi:hypothetical protein
MSEPAAFLGGVCQIFDSEDPLRSDTTLLVASLLTLGIPSAGRDLFHCTYENVRGAVQFNTVWTLRGESSCKRFGTPAMQKAWQDHAWLAANPAHPLAILRSGLTYARAMTYTPRFTLAELAAIERPETWLEAAFRNLIYLLRNIPSPPSPKASSASAPATWPSSPPQQIRSRKSPLPPLRRKSQQTPVHLNQAMTPEERTQKNALSFLDTVLSAGNFKPPPALLSSSSIIFRLLEMKLGTGEAMEPSPSMQKLDQVHAFLFIQAAPAPRCRPRRARVRQAREGEGQAAAWEDWLINHVDPFLTQIPPEGIAAAMEQIEQLGEVDAAIVTAEPPAHHKPERQDPN